MTWSIHGVNFIVVRPALHNVSQTNEKNTPNIWLFWQRKIFCTKFGSFCTIQKRFDQNWIKNSIAVRVYLWAFFANLDFPNSLPAPYCIDSPFSFWTITHWQGLHRTWLSTHFPTLPPRWEEELPEKEKKVRRWKIVVLIVKEDDFWPKRLFGLLISSGYLHQVLRCSLSRKTEL